MPDLSKVLRRARVAVFAMALLAGMATAEANASDLINDDHKLWNFIFANDVVLSRTFSSCQNIKLSRNGHGDMMTVMVKAKCEIKQNPEEDLDCPSYQVDLAGTVDNAIQATVRQLSFHLYCTA